MATKSSSRHHVKSHAKTVVAEGQRVRERVRDMSVNAFKGGQMNLKDMPRLVSDILDGAAQGVDRSIPKSASNVLREVFDGLSDGVHAIASAGSSALGDAREGAKKVMDKDVPEMVKHVREANETFLDAVQKFAGKASRETREQLGGLVDRARRTAPRMEESMRRAAKASDGRIMELAGETAKAGGRVVRRAAGMLAMGAGGMLEGLAEAVMPSSETRAAGSGRKGSKRAKPSGRGTPSATTRKKAGHKAAASRNASKAKSSVKAMASSAKSAAKSAGKAVKSTVKAATTTKKRARATKKTGKRTSKR